MLSSARPDIGSRGEVQLNRYHFRRLAPSESGVFRRLVALHQMLSSARPDIGSRGEVQLNRYHFRRLAPSESPGDTPHVPQETPHVPAGYTPRAAGGESRPAGLKSFLVFFIKCYPVPVPTLAPEGKHNSIANISGVLLLLFIKCYPVPVPTLAPEEKYNSIANIFGVFKCYPVPVPTLAPEVKYNSIAIIFGVLLRQSPRGIRPTSRKRRLTYPQGTPHEPQAGGHVVLDVPYFFSDPLGPVQLLILCLHKSGN
jgi:aromatic ring-cleaving dioxygenase